MRVNEFRENVAEYYDLAPHRPDDVPFYRNRLPGPDSRVLELGCGTGRVTVPLAADCAFIHGIDHSPGMLELCRSKLESAEIPPDRVRLSSGDIASFDLGQQFDLIIAPFRVIQNLETDEQFDGLMKCIANHLAPGGRCILNAFRPRLDGEAMRATWVTETEKLAWEVELPDGRLACYDHRAAMDLERLVLYPRLIYREYRGEELVNEAVLEIAMRCFYPEEFLERIEVSGFAVTGKWGGYAGEEFGVGRELVVEFEAA